MPAYVPEKGDLITLSFDPEAGHEQKGRRPALVISNQVFNQATAVSSHVSRIVSYRGK
ncbi:MAG: type II toxin-antitoxin system PemK/MazF family toxin [Pyrinomonadaceae bacterium]